MLFNHFFKLRKPVSVYDLLTIMIFLMLMILSVIFCSLLFVNPIILWFYIYFY